MAEKKKEQKPKDQAPKEVVTKEVVQKEIVQKEIEEKEVVQKEAVKKEQAPTPEVVVKKTKKSKTKVLAGEAHILATFTNTIITLTDESGNALVQYTPARVGFKNSKKKTPYAATKAAFAAATEAIDKYGIREVKVFIKGAGVGRNAAVKGLASAGLSVTLLADVTRTPHNGCRPPRKPRK